MATVNDERNSTTKKSLLMRKNQDQKKNERDKQFRSQSLKWNQFTLENE